MNSQWLGPYYKETFKLKDFPEINAGTIKWPISTIRLQSKNPDREQIAASDKILDPWRNYTPTKMHLSLPRQRSG